MSTRHCTRCDRDRVVGEEIAVRGLAVCHDCAREHHAEGRRRWMREHPEKRRAANRRYQAAHRERRLEERRLWGLQPEVQEKLSEARRMAYRLRREREGHPVRPLTPEQYERRYGPMSGAGPKGNIDAAPLVEAIRRWRAMGGEIEELAARADVSSRLVRRIVADGSRKCSLPAADRIVAAMGLHIDLIYDDAPGVAR